MERFQLLAQALHTACKELELRKDEPMWRHTSFRIGGPVALMALPSTREQALTAVRVAAQQGVEPFFIGNGSNLLVTDGRMERFIIKTSALRRCRVQNHTMDADCGATLARLAVKAKEHALTGMEFAHGIPGTLGGAVTMNAGAYGGEMADVVTEVTCLNADGTVEHVKEMGFSYRHSTVSDGGRMILSARLVLAPGTPEQIAARMEELALQRRAKQPLEYPSAGSIFKRPQGHFAAALIDQCGLKGLRIGAAQVSEKHAGFIVNLGGATCTDVLALVDEVRRRVLDETGVKLELEVKVLQ